MLRDFLNIKKLKKQEQNSSRDEKLNKNLLHRKNKNKNKAEKRLKRASKMKKYQLEKTGEISRKKRIRIALLIVTTVFLALIIRVAWIQFHNGDSLQQMAYLQQTLDRKINPKRGTIYDATGKTVLATSSSVETITINPVNISKENKLKGEYIMSKDFFGEEEDLITDDDELFTLTDEDGNEIKFEFLDLIELENENYVVLYPVDNDNEEVVILRVQETEGDQDEYLSVDEKTLQTVYAIFKEKFKDVYDFQD